MDTKTAIRQLVEIYSRKIKKGLLDDVIDTAGDVVSNALKLTQQAFANPRSFYLSHTDQFPTHCFDREVMSFGPLRDVLQTGDAASISSYIEKTITSSSILFALSDYWHEDRFVVHDSLELVSDCFVKLSRINTDFAQRFTTALRDALGSLATEFCVFGERVSQQLWMSRFCCFVFTALPALDMQSVLELLRPFLFSPEIPKLVGRFPPSVLSRAVAELQNLFAIQVVTVNSSAPDSPIVLTAAVISVLHKGNTAVNSRGVIDYKEFYNATAISLEMDDIVRDFEVSLRNRGRSPDQQLFCFSRFPCLVDTKFKSLLLQFDSVVHARQAMRDAAISQLFGSQGAENPFFTLAVRRDRLVQSTLAEIERKSSLLQKPLRVEFVGEQGVDAGGVRKEFFQILMKELLDPNFGMFIANEKRELWFQPKARCLVSNVEFHLIGTLIGLAVFNNVILDVPFPNALYRKLLGCPMDFDDLREVDPGLASGLEELLRFQETEEFTVEDVFCREFIFEYEVFDERREVELCPGGKHKTLTAANRKEYVDLVADLVLNTGINEQFESFKKGFAAVASRDLMHTMHPAELELLVCGQRTFDFNELQKSTRYEGFEPTDATVTFLWEVLHSLSTDDQRLFLKFTTGSDRVPVGGLKELNFVVGKNGDDEMMLPTSHTCFNHLLLPSYKSAEALRSKLLLAIQNCQGFGLR